VGCETRLWSVGIASWSRWGHKRAARGLPGHAQRFTDRCAPAFELRPRFVTQQALASRSRRRRANRCGDGRLGSRRPHTGRAWPRKRVVTVRLAGRSALANQQAEPVAGGPAGIGGQGCQFLAHQPGRGWASAARAPPGLTPRKESKGASCTPVENAFLLRFEAGGARTAGQQRTRSPCAPGLVMGGAVAAGLARQCPDP